MCVKKAVIQPRHEHQSQLALHRDFSTIFFQPWKVAGNLSGVPWRSLVVGATGSFPWNCWTQRVNEELFHHFHHWLSRAASDERVLCTFIFLGCHSLFKE